MERTTRNDIEKFAYIMRLLRTLYLATNEEISDHPMRVLMRYVFVQVDNLEKLAGRLKNKLVKSGHLMGAERTEVESAIKRLLSSYSGSLDVIRDKMAAHGQQMEAQSFLDHWSFIDSSSIDVLYDDAFALEQAFRKCKLVDFAQVGGDFVPTLGVAGSPLKEAGSIPVLAVDRAGQQRPNAVAIIPSKNSAMNATQLSVSIVDALLIDFQISALVDNPRTVYTNYLFNIAWLMAITDTCSLVDVLYDEDSNGASVVSLWGDEAMKGVPILKALDARRDHEFEQVLRRTRNRFAAHLDVSQPLATLLAEYNDIDLRQAHAYAIMLLQGFQCACRADIRTLIFACHGNVLPDAILVPKTIKSFRT